MPPLLGLSMKADILSSGDGGSMDAEGLTLTETGGRGSARVSTGGLDAMTN